MHPKNSPEIDTLIAGLPATTAPLLVSVTALEADGQQDLAVEILFRAVTRRPNFELRMALAERCLARGNPNACVEHLSVALLEREDGEAHFLLARGHIALGDKASARASIDAAAAHGIAPTRLISIEQELESAKDTREELPPDARTHPHQVDDEVKAQSDDSTRVIKKNRVTSEMKSFSRSHGPAPQPRAPSQPPGLPPKTSRPAVPAGSRTTSPIDAPASLKRPVGKVPGSASAPAPALPSDEASPFEPTSVLTSAKIARALAERDASDPTKLISGARVSRHVEALAKGSPRTHDWEEANAAQATELHRDPDPHGTDPYDDQLDRQATSLHDPADHDHDTHDYAALPELDDAPPHGPGPGTARSGEQPHIRPADALLGTSRQRSFGLDEKPSRIIQQMSRVIRVAAARQIDALTPAKAARIAVVLTMSLTALGLVSLLVISQLQSSRISALLEQADLLESTDIYTDYQRALLRLDEARTDRILAEPIDAFVFGTLPSFFVGRVVSERELVSARHLLLEAYLEARFEHAGARDLPPKLAIAPLRAETAAARVYQQLALEDFDEALRIADASWDHFGAHLSLVEARLEALIATQSWESSNEVRQYLRPFVQNNTRLRFLMLRLDRGESSDASIDAMRELLQVQSPEHIGARLEIAEAMADDPRQARALFQNIITTLADRAGPMERARAHHGLALLHLAENEPAAAEEHLIHAIRLVPLRGSLYASLMSMYLKDGRLQEARRLLARVPRVTPRSNYFVLSLAELYLWSGMPSRTLETLKEADLATERAAWLRGWAQLELGHLDEARQALHQARQGQEMPAAQGLGLYVRALQTPERVDLAIDELNDLREDHPHEPMIALSLGRAYQLASQTTSDPRRYRDYLSDSIRAVGDALALMPNHALLLYTLCESQRLFGDIAQARENCQLAMRINSEYVPGQLTFARVRLDEGRAQEALNILERLDESHRNNPDLSLLLARAAMDGGERQRARDELNRWVGTPVESSAEWTILEGRQAYLRKDYPRAIGYFQLAHRDHPASGEAALYFAQTLQRLDRGEEAQAILIPLREHPRWGNQARDALKNSR